MKSDQVKQYDCFVDDAAKLQDGIEIELVIRDLTPGKRKYESRYVRAMIASPERNLPGLGMLSVRNKKSGKLDDKKWQIKILDEMGDYKT